MVYSGHMHIKLSLKESVRLTLMTVYPILLVKETCNRDFIGELCEINIDDCMCGSELYNGNGVAMYGWGEQLYM